MAYAVAAALASSAFAMTAWHSRRPSSRPARRQVTQCGLQSAGNEVIDAMRAALNRVAPLMSQYNVRADVAVLPGLVARIRNTVLTDVIEDMLTAAIRGAPACRLLLTAIAQGDHLEVTVTDDLPNAHQAYRLGQVRGLHERVASLGGTLHVTAHPIEGTTLAVRLAASSGSLHGSSASRAISSSQGAFSFDTTR
jgi:glucose-6-phosphate-specific signal transduction histidine kinase